MRIIAGELKGRRLESPLDDRVRPTTDKVREAIFNMISHYIEDAEVIDLFAGTGGLGLEAISRGADHVYFVDNSRDSIRIINQNIDKCGVREAATVLTSDYRRALKMIGRAADIIFLDPPYKAGFMQECIELIVRNGCLAPDGIIIAEHGTDEHLPDEISELVKIKEKRYGKINVSVYGRINDTNEDELITEDIK